MKRLKNRLENGLSVVLFPEGTTAKGPLILPYKPGMFYTVAEGSFTIYAGAIDYRDGDIAWVDDMTFVPHFFKILKKSSIEVNLAYSEPFIHSDARLLKTQVENWTQNKINSFRT